MEAPSSPEFSSGSCRYYVVNLWEKIISAPSEKRYNNVSFTENKSNSLCYLIVRVVQNMYPSLVFLTYQCWPPLLKIMTSIKRNMNFRKNINIMKITLTNRQPSQNSKFHENEIEIQRRAKRTYKKIEVGSSAWEEWYQKKIILRFFYCALVFRLSKWVLWRQVFTSMPRQLYLLPYRNRSLRGMLSWIYWTRLLVK